MKARGARIHACFVEDTVTRVAYWWNACLGGFDISLRVGNVVELVDRVLQSLKQLGDNVTIDALELAGHGYPGGWRVGLDLSDPQQPPSSPEFKRWSRLAELKPHWSTANDGLTMRMCHTAQGERGQLFLAALAKTVGANVRGWTGCYEIRATGFEYSATPNGLVTRSGNTGRHWQILYHNQAKSRLRRILTAPVEGLQWSGRMADLW
jgi:hypothetical protein